MTIVETTPPHNAEERLVWWNEYRVAELTGADSFPSDAADARLREYRSKFPTAPPDTRSADRIARIAAEVQAWERDDNRNSFKTVERIVAILRESSGGEAT